MASGTRRRPCRVQGRVFEPPNFTPSRSPLPFGGPDKLTDAQAAPGPSNVPAVDPGPPDTPVAAPAGSASPQRVYLYAEMQDIIQNNDGSQTRG